MRDVYNARHRLRIESLAGQTPIQALFSQLSANDFEWEYLTSEAGNVTHLFFAPMSSIDLVEFYPEVVLLDCTYKTNRFGLPLLNIIGITGLGTSFYLAFAFLRAEAEKDFTWALEQLAKIIPHAPNVIVTDRDLALMNALQVVFPDSAHLLCQWHIRKNVVSRSKLHFRQHRPLDETSGEAQRPYDTDDPAGDFVKTWDQVTFSSTALEYKRRWDKLKDEYKSEAALLTYLQNTWIPWRKRFMAPWINQHLHLGTVVTSRVESAHSVLKRYLEVSSLHIVRMLLSSNLCLRCRPVTYVQYTRIYWYLFAISMQSILLRWQSSDHKPRTMSTSRSLLSCMATSQSQLCFESTKSLSNVAGATSPHVAHAQRGESWAFRVAMTSYH